jgi:hypothetical protein
MDQGLDHEWRNFELYEKVRVREHRKRFWIITLAVLLFFTLCAVPVVDERLPKWKTLDAARSILIRLEKMKTRSIQEKKPIRVSFRESGELVMELVADCKSQTAIQVIEKEIWSKDPENFKVLSRSELDHFKLKVGSDEICFDPVFGLDGVKNQIVLVVVPVKDLSAERLDRASYVILEGESAKISIN